MPPTPFHPTHLTPFKSTVSTSQQHRDLHTPFESLETTQQLSISDIDPAEWRYHAEGGKSILLTFDPSVAVKQGPFVTPTCTYALRIPKSLSPSAAADEQEEEDADQFTIEVIVPLLGEPSVLPQCVKIPITTARDKSIIDTLAGRIELQRPAARRASLARIRADILTHIYAVQDVTAPISSSQGSKNVLTVEIKPKWGFLPRVSALPAGSPNVQIKQRYSRYRMHRVAKAQGNMTRERFEELYDPLDLYSSDKARMEKAVKALWANWKGSHGETNNLRLFWNGAVVQPDDSATLRTVATFLGAAGGEPVEALTKHLVADLSKPTLPNQGDQGAKVSILHRLAHLQSSLDPLDVEGLAELWHRRTQSQVLGQLPASNVKSPPGLTASLPSNQLLPLLQPFLSSSLPAQIELEDALQAFLVSASFKDCSLLIRFATTEEGKVEGETKLVDLDRKPFSKLASMQKTDDEVCSAFMSWLSSLSEAPSASIPP